MRGDAQFPAEHPQSAEAVYRALPQSAAGRGVDARIRGMRIIVAQIDLTGLPEHPVSLLRFSNITGQDGVRGE